MDTNRRLQQQRISSLVVNPVGALQTQHVRESSPPTKEDRPLRNEKDEDEGEVWRRVGKAQARI